MMLMMNRVNNKFHAYPIQPILGDEKTRPKLKSGACKAEDFQAKKKPAWERWDNSYAHFLVNSL